MGRDIQRGGNVEKGIQKDGFAACGDFEEPSVAEKNDSDSSMSVLSLYEGLQDNEEMPYTLTEKAKTTPAILLAGCYVEKTAE